MLKILGNHKGSALLSALFIMTLVAIAATAMSTRLQMDIYRTRQTLLSDKIYLAEQTLTFWAMSVLADKRNRFTASDNRGKVMELPKSLQTLYPSLQIEGSIYDLQSRFNLNNLQDNKYYPIFLNLLTRLLPKASAEEKQVIALSTRQWISPWQPDRGQDEYVDYYLKQRPPYYPGQQAFTSVSEFRLVRGVSALVYLSLEPFITALAEKTPINFNTASRELLLSMGNDLTEDQINALLAARGKNGLADLKPVSSLLGKFNLREELFTVKSTWFLCLARVKSGDRLTVSYTILKREEDKNGNISVHMAGNSINTI